MQITAQILYRTDDGRDEWHARQYVHSAAIAGARPSLMVGIYPIECAAGLEHVLQVLRWLMERQPRILAFRVQSDTYEHEERREAA